MAQQQRIYVYEIPTIPDCTHHSLVTLCGGNVREHIFRASEHLLRMIANFQEGQIALAIRFIFKPGTDKGIQQRLKLQLAVKIGEGVSEDTVRQLIDSGPLSEFYEIQKAGGPRAEGKWPQKEYLLEHDFPAVCEVIRQEETVKPLVSKEQNPGRIPAVYYSLYPLETRPDNDYLMIDTLLSKMENPCVVEMLVCPVDQKKDLEAQYKYITRLRSVNEYGDDSYSNSQTDDIFEGEEDYQQRPTMLSIERKRDPMADDIAQEHQEFHRKLRQPQLLFNIKAFAMNQENALMLASVTAECGFSGGKYNLVSYNKKDSQDRVKWLDDSCRNSCKMDISLHAMYPGVWSEELPKGYWRMSRLCHMASVDELKGIIRLPVGGHGSPRSIRKSTDPQLSTDKKSILIGDDLESKDTGERTFDDLSSLSNLFNCAKPNNLESRLPLTTLTKHMFVAGVPGSGKTTAVYNMLVQLFRHGKPFLVIETAKTEYRILKSLQNHPDDSVKEMARQLRIYSPGNDMVSPFRFNPLFFPEGITLDEHISQILSCFEAAMPMGGPLQALIAEAVEEVYKYRSPGDFPRMNDLAEAAGRIMEKKKYEGEIKSNLQAAIEVRLGMLTRQAMGRIFQCQSCIPSIKELLEYPTIIEMDYLSQNHACLLTLFLLSSIREQIKIDPNRRHKDLHHVTVVEEAHNIVGRTGSAKASEEIADPKAFAAQYISRMLAELRALGEGIIIADQLPSAVAPEVVKNTGTKLAHRLVSNEDREDLGGAMLLGGTEIEEIARLKPGEAYFYTEGLHLPRRVRCLNTNIYLKLTDFIDATSIVAVITEEDWFNDNKKNRMSALRKTLSKALEDARSAAVKHDAALKSLLRQYEEITEEKQYESEGEFKKKSGRLKEDSAYYDTSVGETIDAFDARFDTLSSFSQNSSDGLTKVAELIFNLWEEEIRPQLIELAKGFYTIESNL
ncbi:MAG: ATP-binding protein [Planctomycetes bacterium]|nr:ATP-binding protein [Planctomycetota bacterium]